MFNKISSVFKFSNIETIFNTAIGASNNSRSKTLPPMALGGSLILGVLTTIFGGYRIADCIRYQTAAGQCDVVIKENIPTIAAGLGTLSAGWGGFNTFNPKLHEEPSATTLPTKELVLDKKDIPAPEISVTPHPEIIQNLYSEGNSQVKVAEMLGISLYAVRKALKEKDKKATKKVK
jgi:hypothetical protein